MVTILLTILKIIGIILLCILLLILALLFLVLFVPIRYQVKGYRKEGDEVPVRAALKITWLLHILNMAFQYPEAAYLKVRIFCFTVFSTNKEKSPDKTSHQKTKKEKDADMAEEKKTETAQKQDSQTADAKPEQTRADAAADTAKNPERREHAAEDIHKDEWDGIEADVPPEAAAEEKEPELAEFLKKLFSALKNIKYTICKIYDKIKHIIKNIRYYIKIIKSDPFQRAWKVCCSEVLKLLKAVLPSTLSADFIIGTGDPAATAQILSVQGILYPLIGDHISITPDFEHSVVEGNFYIKGRITVFKILVTVIKVYFNKDLRKIIRLFKKEAV